MILPNTDADGVFYVAQLIGIEFEKLKIPLITLSLGIANMIPSNDVEAESLIVTAEEELGVTKVKGQRL
ncbi:MAG: hypothetical protein WBA07_19895 [Rivularia sp. (in: cyanobacteria)]